MAVVINGSGTVTGLAVGGLPDGIVDDGTLATDSVTAAKLKDDAITVGDLPAGSVLQVSSSSLGGTGLETSTNTDADMCTVTLTPNSSSNKLLILASNAQAYAASNAPEGEVRVYSDLTSAYLGNCSTYQNQQNAGYVGGGTISIEHSLSTWSSGSVTIRLKGRSKNSVYIQLAAYGLATLTVMEISS